MLTPNAQEIFATDIDHSVAPLFQPIRINSLELKNRIIMPAMGHGKARGGVLGPRKPAATPMPPSRR